VQGERPYSWLKIGCLTVAILGLILFIVMLVAVFKRWNRRNGVVKTRRSG